MSKSSIHLFLLLSLFSFCLLTCQNQVQEQKNSTKEKPADITSNKTIQKVQQLTVLPSIDGLGDDPSWQNLKWHPIDQVWLGNPPSKDDFSGRYKIAWAKDFLYLLVEVTDDQLVDTHPDGLQRYWDDDCVEVFIDENHSGGNHQYSHNAFAYHIATDYKVADIGPDSLPHYYNDHVNVKRTQNEQLHTWEMAIAIYDDTFVDNGQNRPKQLASNKTMGFAIAYCDNDQSKERENFIGSVFVPGEDKNRGWIDAGIFGSILLVE